MFDALIDPLQLVIVVLMIAIVGAAARWGNALAPKPTEAEETDDRPTTD